MSSSFAENFQLYQHKIAGMGQGFFWYFLFVGMLITLLIVFYKRYPAPDSHARTALRMGIVIGFIALLLQMGAVHLAHFAGLLIVVVIALSWLPHLPRLSPLPFIVLLALVLRLPFMFESLWYDEAFTAGLVSRSLPEMWTVILSDVHPPGFYLLEWIVVRVLGTSEFVLRLPSLLAGLATVWGMYRLCSALKLWRNTCLTAAFIVAILPAHIYYSTEARAYALLALLVVLALYALLTEKKGLLFITLFCLPLLHATGYLYLLVFAGVTLLYRRNLWGMLAGGILAAGVWLPLMLLQSQDVANGFWLQFSLPGSLLIVPHMSIGWFYPDSLLLLLVGAIIGITLLSLYVCRHCLKQTRGVLLLLLIFMPPLIAALISLLWRPVYLDRALLASVLLLIPLWAYTLTQLYSADTVSARLIVYPALLIALMGMFTADSTRINIRDNLRRFCDHTESVYSTSTAIHFLTTYYLPDKQQIVWHDANDLNQTLPMTAKAALGWQSRDFNDTQGDVCILYFAGYLTRDAERAEIAAIQARYETYSRVINVNNNGVFTLITVERPS